MATGWDGADPAGQDDGLGTYYELGELATATGDITIYSVRVWHPAQSNTVPGRRARVWSAGGTVLAEVEIGDTLSPGWSVHTLPSPVERTAGSQFVVSYSTRQYYGAVAGGYPNPSADGLVEYTGGRFIENITFPFPTTPTSSFYGVDVVYEAGIGGNVAPTVNLSVSVSGSVATATAVVGDETPGSVTLLYDWGDGSTTATSSTTAQHTYAAPGTYPVFVVATDNGGLQGFDAAVATVADPGGISGGYLLPTAELVAVAWLRTVVPGGLVATDVPADNASWAASGFVQVSAVGGTPDPDVPMNLPVVSVDCWAVNPNSDKPPWGKANQLAAIIRRATLDHAGTPRLLTTLPAAYNHARVLSAYMLTEPARLRDDAGDYAHYQFDLALMWVEVPR